MESGGGGKAREQRSGSGVELPWGGVKWAGPSLVDASSSPGEYAATSLFVEFVMVAERKIQAVLSEPLERSLTKALQRGEDPAFDQLLSSLCGVAEHCLPSLLRALFLWYDEQNKQLLVWLQQKQHLAVTAAAASKTPKSEPKEVRDFGLEKRGLAVDFLFCLVLIEVLKQLPLHPGHDEQISWIIQLAFKQFKYKDPQQLGVVSHNTHVIADLFAEVIGVLTQSRFHMIRKKFMAELGELRGRDSQLLPMQNIIALLMGIKFFRVKMHPIEDFENSVSFLHELGNYFLEVKEKDVKHALAGLFVEILFPVAANVKTEVNIPALKQLVELLFAPVLELASKNKHKLHMFPLLTCLLCISNKPFFLTNWHYFLQPCLSSLRVRDSKLSRVALESLFRLLWVYIIRIKCESNRATDSRLQSICSSLFPRGGRTVTPRDTPLNIFVKIIHFIAQERLDFAFKDIIFDLLCVGRPIRSIYPERMNVGLRALIGIADSLQQRDGPPPMPRSIGTLPSGTTLRVGVKKTYLTRPLTADVARSIGLDVYYGPCRRAFDGILRCLDSQVGRPLMLNVVTVQGKDPEELLGGDRKPKLDLFRTCLAAVPRLLPDGMSHQDLIDLLARMTLHMEEELRQLACQTLQNLMAECPDWREDVIHGFLQFISRDIPDAYTSLLDNSLRLLVQLLSAWRSAATGRPRPSNPPQPPNAPQRVQVSPLLKADGTSLVLHCVEGLALVMLCQGRASPRKLALSLMKEVKSLLPLLCGDDHERPVLDVLDAACPHVLAKYIQQVGGSGAERSVGGSGAERSAADFAWMLERIPSLETDVKQVNVERGNEYFQWDAWAAALSGFTEPAFLLRQAPTACAYAWPAAYLRLTACFTYVDPNNPQNDTRASLLRSSKSKGTGTALLCGESLGYNHYLCLWQKYLVLACAVAPPATNSPTIVHSSSSINLSSDGDSHHQTSHSLQALRTPLELRIPRVANVSASNLFKLVVPLLRCEMTDMRDIVVLGLGSVNHSSLECLIDELAGMLREAAERKAESVRRRRRRDLLRLQLIRLMEVLAFRHTLPSAAMLDPHGQLKPVLLDFLESARLFLESDQDRDVQTFASLKLHFAKMSHLLIRSFPPEKRAHLLPAERRHSLFILFTSWSNRLALVFDKRHAKDSDSLSPGEHHAVSAMCAVLCAGPVFEASKAIGDESGYLYGWLDALLSSRNAKVAELTAETLVLLLDFNAETPSLLDWLLDHCYTAAPRIADHCFRALATVFAQREYPCDIVAIFNLALMYSGSSQTSIRHMAVELLQILETRFFQESELRGPRAGEEMTPRPSRGTELSFATSLRRNHVELSEALSQLHPDMTIALCSEISQKLQTASGARRGVILEVLVPWLRNVELVDPQMEPSSREITLSLSAKVAESHALSRRVLKGEGWGSPPATELVLNNLLHLTIKLTEEEPRLAALWGALVSHWPANLRVILRYLQVTLTLNPDTLLPFAKRIIVYLARLNPERLTEEIINELRTTDAFRIPLERSEMAPFYRWAKRVEEESGPVGISETESGVGSSSECSRTESAPADGHIHTRRHTPCDVDAPSLIGEADEKTPTSSNRSSFMGPVAEEDVQPDISASMASLVTLKPDGHNANSPPLPTLSERLTSAGDQQLPDGTPTLLRQYIHAYQLPMPAYGGYYCKLAEFLPPVDVPVNLLPRSSLALLLIGDLVTSHVDIDWVVHLPLILHTALLGLDQSRMLVNDHCKRLIIHLLVIHSEGALDPRQLASVLLHYSIGSLATLGLPSARHSEPPGSNSNSAFDSLSSRASTAILADHANSTTPASESPLTTPTPVIRPDCRPPKEFCSLRKEKAGEAVLEMIHFLGARMGQAMWAYEDVTARQWRIGSGEAVGALVSQLSGLLALLVPAASIERRWADTALQLALNCSNRHYAGRSFQAFRALHVPPTSETISDILSRLVETVGEQGDDMQGYVTEIILTLDSSILNMEVAEHSLIGHFRACANSLEEETTEATPTEVVVAGPPPALSGLFKRNSPTHTRSTSYNAPSLRKRLSPLSEKRVGERVGERGEEGGGLPRSKSAQALMPEGQEKHVRSLSQLLWIATSLLESEQEHELALGLQLVQKLMELPELERVDVLKRLEWMVKELQWSPFPGLLSLVLKGATLPGCYEPTANLLLTLVEVLEWGVVDRTESGFALVVIALLPYLIHHYEEPNRLCVRAAEQLAAYCSARLATVQEHQALVAESASAPAAAAEHPLEHLGTVMRLYAKRAFSRDCFQWTKCVVKYLHDASTPQQGLLLLLLSEMLDRWSAASSSVLGPALVVPVLQLMFCVYHHLELAAASSHVPINAHFLRTVAKHVQGPNWREAGRILKLAVTRNSSFFIPAAEGSADAEGEPPRRELPGRTLEFNLDVPLVTSLSLGKDVSVTAASEAAMAESPRKPQSSDSALRRSRDPNGQIRVREHLVNLLKISPGLRVGLPKSPSVIFSQSSHDIGAEQPSSVYSASSGELTTGGPERASTPSPSDPNADFNSDSFPRVFKEFDFLEAEHDSVSESADSCFNWLHTMRPRSISSAEVASLPGAVAVALPDQPAADEDDRSLVVMGESAMSEASFPPRPHPASPSSSSDDDDASSHTEEDGNGSLADAAGPLSIDDHPASSGGDSYEQQASPPQPVLLRPDQPQPVPLLAALAPTGSRASLSGSVGTPSVEWGRDSVSLFGSVPPAFPAAGLGWAAAHSFPPFTLECSHHATGQTEENWNAAVAEMNNDPDGSATAHASLVFAQLYRESCTKVCGLLRDACHFLGMSVNFRGIAAQFLDALDVLMRMSDCPFLFVTPQLLRVEAVLARQRLDVFELREHFETFQERREHAIRTLNSVKSSLKLQLLGQKLEEQASIDQEIDLCRSLHKLFFQLLLMIESFKKMVEQLTSVGSSGAGRLSGEVVVLQRELLCAAAEIGSGGGGSGPGATEQGGWGLARLLSQQDYRGALRALRWLRAQTGGRGSEAWGCCEEEDVEVLLLLHCRTAAEAGGGTALAVVGSEAALSESAGQLRETNLCLSAAVRTLSTSLRHPRLSLHSSSSHLSGPPSTSTHM